VTAESRFAVYFVPAADTALYRFGSAALGYDCYTGGDVAQFSDIAMNAAEWAALTREPRTYGFHATLKAPFRLHPGYDQADLVAKFSAFVASIHRPPVIVPEVEILDGFVAIVPKQPDPDLDALAGACVRAFDHFRAPMQAEERARRSHPELSHRQTENIDRWGYPYVFEDFRFHMTLTGRIQSDRRDWILSILRERFSRCHDGRPVPIDGIALLRQDSADARFRVICHSSGPIS